jgi:hypothetical protein
MTINAKIEILIPQLSIKFLKCNELINLFCIPKCCHDPTLWNQQLVYPYIFIRWQLEHLFMNPMINSLKVSHNFFFHFCDLETFANFSIFCAFFFKFTLNQ